MKKKLLTLVVGTGLIMGLTACAGNKDTAADPGAKVYDQKCSSCHGGDLKGGIGLNLTKVGSKYSKDQILDIIHNGRGQMPANVVSGDDANNVAEWLSKKK